MRKIWYTVDLKTIPLKVINMEENNFHVINDESISENKNEDNKSNENNENYYAGLYELISKQQNGEATWADVVRYREDHGIKSTYDYVQRGSAILSELLKAGYHLTPPNKTKYSNLNEINSSEPDVSYNSSDNSYTYTKLIGIVKGENLTPEKVMELYGLDCKKWVCSSFSSSYRNTTRVDEYTTLPIVCYNVRITVKPKLNEEIDYEAIKKYFSDFKTPHRPRVIQKVSGDKLFVPCFYDVHFGKLGWHGELGENENYDLEIAKKRFLDNSYSYIDDIQDKGIEKILYVIGQDFIHSEPDGSTINKTKQDCDGRYQKIFQTACEALIESIESFADIAPVDVVLVQGNHSETSEFFMAEFIRAYFRNDSRIKVDSSPVLRKYYRYGETLLGLSHGEYEGKRIWELMPAEAKEFWGLTTFHEFLLGHLHSESTQGNSSVIIRRIPSICGVDAWSKKMGYNMSPKRSVGFIYDKKYGLSNTIYKPVENI